METLMRSKKSLWIASSLVVMVAAAGAWNTLSAQALQPPPPPGVAAANWISISGSSGFVILKLVGARDVVGYFMIKHQGAWLRVTGAPPQTRPLTLGGGD
jgi:hypothetical protein